MNRILDDAPMARKEALVMQDVAVGLTTAVAYILCNVAFALPALRRYYGTRYRLKCPRGRTTDGFDYWSHASIPGTNVGNKVSDGGVRGRGSLVATR